MIYIYIYILYIYIYRYKSIVFMAFINQSDKIGAAACITDMAPFFVTEVSRLKSPGTSHRAASMAVVCYLWELLYQWIGLIGLKSIGNH